MQPAHAGEVAESVSQAVEAWRLFTSVMDGADRRDEPGVSFVYGDVPLSFMNAAVATAPVPDEPALDRIAERAAAYMKTRRFPGMLFLCEDLLAPGVRPQAAAVAARHGLYPAMRLTGMAAASLLPPERPAAGVTFRRVAMDETAEIVSDINSRAYGMPLEMGRASLPAALWTGRSWGYIAYAGGQPASCAATFPVDGRLYVALVATLPEARARGYAEAVMRHSVEQAMRETGLGRTVLHATGAGLPIYKRMGYRETALFTIYSPAP